MARKLRLLTFSTLYPSSARPGHGIFVETRLRELLASGEVESRVIAPVPWFPSKHPRWGAYAKMAGTPRREQRNGIDVQHPRYALPPKVGMTMAPLSLALGAVPAVRRLRREGYDFDAIDAHYYYPDGVAAALLGRWFGRPVAVTARGTDLNLISRFAMPRRMLQWAVAQADASVAVSSALSEILRQLGAPADRIHVMRNGVDLDRFRPLPQAETRRALGFDAGGPVLISVGNLIELKGHALLIEALALLKSSHPDARLIIVGEGPERAALLHKAQACGVASRVSLTGALPNEELLRWYSAADVALLASSREGWANVLLEAMACGTPVIATRVGGSPEVVAEDTAGRLVGDRSARAFAQAIAETLAQPIDRRAVRAYAERFSWQHTTEAQLKLFGRLAQAPAVEGHVRA
jgi:teichuronic acid biosynthesis glycosyltransferase TuaC